MAKEPKQPKFNNAARDALKEHLRWSQDYDQTASGQPLYRRPAPPAPPEPPRAPMSNMALGAIFTDGKYQQQTPRSWSKPRYAKLEVTEAAELTPEEERAERKRAKAWEAEAMRVRIAARREADAARAEAEEFRISEATRRELMKQIGGE